METLTGKVRFGVCTDVHKDIMHDAEARLQIFIERMNQEHVDFILQLGDFCRPYDYNRSFMKVWEAFAGPRYHVLGNHDTDGGFTRDQVLAYWSMPARYSACRTIGWGEDYLQVRYSEAIDQEYPWIKYTAPYRDPLYALITLGPDAGMRVEGVESIFVGSSPWDLNYPHRHLADRLIPQIRNRRLALETAGFTR